MKTKYKNLAIFVLPPPSLLATENLENQFFFKIIIFNLAFWRNFNSGKQKRLNSRQGLWTWPQEKKKVTEGRH
jgi:hypothetical protein